MDRPTKEVLKLVPLFSKFDDESLEKLESFIEEKTYRDGDILFRENSFGDTFYIIKKGCVEIIKEDDEGREKVTLAMRRSGDFFGEMALLENSPRFATARVSTESHILELSKAAFISLLYEVPIVAFEIMGVLASRLRQSDIQAIKDLKEKNVSLEKISKELEDSNRRLNRTKKFLERIISVSPDIVVVTDKNGVIYIFNQVARDIYGYSYDEIRGKNMDALISPNCPTETKVSIDNHLKKNETYHGEVLGVRKNGDEFIQELTACNIIGANDKLIGILYLSRDITESKELERQAQTLDRMAARGQMAGEVAHELNNYISVLSGNLELMTFDLEDVKNEALEKKMNAMRTAIERMTMFTNGLMSFAQPQYEFTDVELNKFLEAELAFLRPQKRFRRIQITSDFDERIETIDADPAGLQQILYNLLNNAADALNNANRNDGKIDVITRLLDQENCIEFCVSDNGPGMSPDEKERAFKQSFTTKSSGHGFGLITINNVTKVHKGTVKVESEKGVGTEFIIKLPISRTAGDTTSMESEKELQKTN